MEFECNGSLPFLDILLSRNDNGSFSHRVYHKKTHTEQYLHANSHHFLAQILSVLNTLATRALRVSNDNHLKEGKAHLLSVILIMGIVDTNVLRISLELKMVLVLRKIPRIDFLVFIFLLSKGPLTRLQGS